MNIELDQEQVAIIKTLLECEIERIKVSTKKSPILLESYRNFIDQINDILLKIKTET